MSHSNMTTKFHLIGGSKKKEKKKGICHYWILMLPHNRVEAKATNEMISLISPPMAAVGVAANKEKGHAFLSSGRGLHIIHKMNHKNT